MRPGAAARTWTVGIEDPRDGGRIQARVPVQDGAVATSGTAARGLHIVDPRSGERAANVRSATVIGPSLLWADVYATAAVALGREAVNWVGSLHGRAACSSWPTASCTAGRTRPERSATVEFAVGAT